MAEVSLKVVAGGAQPAASPFPADLIPVLRPRLPTADRILPYLQRIDAARTYSNYGPLVLEFQSRLARLFHTAPECVITASCGTDGLIGAIFACAGVGGAVRPLAVLPAFTFAATAIAVERCGFQPYLVDVDPQTCMIGPAELLDHPNLDRVGVVVAVAPFGCPLAQAEWLAFQQRTGIPVVLDVAASFSSLMAAPATQIGPLPSVLSLHATKSFGVGEGGCVITTDMKLAERISATLNFGFIAARDSALPSINGKLSEYHAAVGLAGLDILAESRASVANVVALYRAEFAAHDLEGRFIGLPQIDGNYALFLCNGTGESQAVQAALLQARVDFRFWYGRGVQHQTHFRNAARDQLPVTEELGQTLIGLPMAPDLSQAAIGRIVAAISATVGRQPAAPRYRTLDAGIA
jgi:dTDP-4-amino-4,6-dideoxygalactose transaminase